MFFLCRRVFSNAKHRLPITSFFYIETLLTLHRLLLPQFEVGPLPGIPESRSRMQDCQGQCGYRNHTTLQYHERDLIIRELSIETFAQFSCTETATDEDPNSCCGET